MSLDLVAKEALVCGLKRVPLIGPVAEIVQGVRLSRQMLDHSSRIGILEDALTNTEKRLRDFFMSEISQLTNSLSSMNASFRDIDKRIKDLMEIKNHGYYIGLFHGLFAGSSYRNEFFDKPQNFGKILISNDKINNEYIQVFCENDYSKVVEISASVLGSLLVARDEALLKPVILASEDIWAFSSRESGLVSQKAHEIVVHDRSLEFKSFKLKISGINGSIMILEGKSPDSNELKMSGINEKYVIYMSIHDRIRIIISGVNNNIGILSILRNNVDLEMSGINNNIYYI